jgi:NAD-dependent deacetylase
VVLFGEALPETALHAAVEASRRARLFIVLGSSLLVSPANLLPEMALAAGAPLVIINRDPTPLGPRATLEIRTSIGEILSATDDLLRTG